MGQCHQVVTGFRRPPFSEALRSVGATWVGTEARNQGARELGGTPEESRWAWAEEVLGKSQLPLWKNPSWGNSGLTQPPKRRLPQRDSDVRIQIRTPTSASGYMPFPVVRSTVHPLAWYWTNELGLSSPVLFSEQRVAVIREVGLLVKWGEAPFIGPESPPPTVPGSQQLSS